MPEISLTDQLACARRELALRKNVYPTWVVHGRMSARTANWELQAMAAIVATLEDLLAEAAGRKPWPQGELFAGGGA